MGSHKKNISGKRFGRWVAIAPSEKKACDGTYFWIYQCDCGTIKTIHPNALKSGKSTSCGCKNARTENKIYEDFCKSYQIKENGCWEWTKKYVDHGGYARFRGIQGSRKRILAHRYSFEKFKGPIPFGINVCHNCPGGDNRKCVNPDHLWIGTHLENNRDKIKKRNSTERRRHRNT